MAMLHYAPRRLASEDILEELAGEPVPPPAVPAWLLEEDLFLALAYFARAADAGNALAARIRGVLAERGMGAIPSLTRAFAWYRLAFDLGDVWALDREVSHRVWRQSAVYDREAAVALCLKRLPLARRLARSADPDSAREGRLLYGATLGCLLSAWDQVPEAQRRAVLVPAQHDALREEMSPFRWYLAEWYTRYERDAVGALAWALLPLRSRTGEISGDPERLLTPETLGYWAKEWWGEGYLAHTIDAERILTETLDVLRAANAGDHRPLFERAEPFLPPPPWAEE